MPDSTRAQPRSELSKPSRPSDSTEERLANAEKEVAIALDTLAYDELILVATEALQTKPQTPSKNVIKSRKNLLWARSHAYHHKSLHELALKDARAALKIDPNDIGAYIRTAVLLSNTGHKTQSLSCLKTARSLASKLDSATSAIWLRRIDKQRRKDTDLCKDHIDQLPHELFIEIASHLNVADRVSLSQTCRSWRQLLTSVPSLWTSLTLVTRQKDLDGSKPKDWIRYILMRSERANHGLEKVVFLDYFPSKLLEKVCNILLKSAASLKLIQIPTQQQELCYDRLYRHCPRLTDLSINEPKDVYIPDAIVKACPHVPTEKQTATIQPFSLESFSVFNPYLTPCRFIDKHLHRVRLLSGFNPFRMSADGTFQDEQLASSIAQHLEEWRIEYGPRGNSTLTLPKLTKLRQCVEESSLISSCPNLLDLEIDMGSGDAQAVDRLIRLLSTSPMLRKLSFVPGEILQSFVQLREVLSRLRRLERLEVGYSYTQDFLSELLLPNAVTSESGQNDVFFPLPKMQYLVANESQTDVNRLTYSLLVREALRLGDNLAKAKHDAAKRVLKSSSSSEPAASPFQRGSTSKESSKLTVKLTGPSLKNRSDCIQLQYLKLTNVGRLSEHIEEALRACTAKLDLEYCD